MCFSLFLVSSFRIVAVIVPAKEDDENSDKDGDKIDKEFKRVLNKIEIVQFGLFDDHLSVVDDEQREHDETEVEFKSEQEGSERSDEKGKQMANEKQGNGRSENSAEKQEGSTTREESCSRKRGKDHHSGGEGDQNQSGVNLDRQIDERTNGNALEKGHGQNGTNSTALQMRVASRARNENAKSDRENHIQESEEIGGEFQPN